MILTAFHGFCMALADSVPGVSGGTIASIPFFFNIIILSVGGGDVVMILKNIIYDFVILFIAAARVHGAEKSSAARRSPCSAWRWSGLHAAARLIRAGKRQLRVAPPFSMLYIFLSGAVAITAMVLPGINCPFCHQRAMYLRAIGLFALLWRVAGVALIPFTPSAPRCTNTAARWSGSILGLMLGSLYAIVYGAGQP